jgi:hypothetical protein
MDNQDKGLDLACRFSCQTNRLRYCGPKDAYIDFYKLFKGEKYDREKVRVHFKRYEGLYVYLSFMSKKLGKEMLDYEIIEAYWLGNGLLSEFTKEDLKNMVLQLAERGLPVEYAKKIAEKIPDGMNPHHSFNVLFVGVGKTTGSVPTNLLTMNKCCILTGKVLEIKKETLIVGIEPLILSRSKMVYGKIELQHVEYVKEMLPGLKTGDYVGVHWDFASKILTRSEIANVKRYTQENIDALNSVDFFKN